MYINPLSTPLKMTVCWTYVAITNYINKNFNVNTGIDTYYILLYYKLLVITIITHKAMENNH